MVATSFTRRPTNGAGPVRGCHRASIGLAVVCAVLAITQSSIGAPAPDLARFEAANRAYESGDFAEARKIYESLVEGPFSSNLFHNLGNACAKTGDVGAALLNYERALALTPEHPEARANLVLLRNRTGARIDPRSVLDYVVMPLSHAAYAVAAAVSAWCVIFGVALARKSRGLRPPAVMATVVAAVVCGYAVLALVHQHRAGALAVITAKQAPARFAPADSAALADTLPAGSQVRILSERGPWSYCALPGRRRAWVATGAVERISLRRS